MTEEDKSVASFAATLAGLEGAATAVLTEKSKWDVAREEESAARDAARRDCESSIAYRDEHLVILREAHTRDSEQHALWKRDVEERLVLCRREVEALERIASALETRTK